MALPPTPLTSLLYQIRWTSVEMLADALKAQGCLPEKHYSKALAAIHSGVARHDLRPDMPGPNLQDDIAAALLDAKVLNLKALPR